METEREKAIRHLQERRAKRGMADPLNRLRAYEEGQVAIVGIPAQPETRLAEIRASIVAENVSYGDIAELQAIAENNPDSLGDDILLREWAGLPE